MTEGQFLDYEGPAAIDGVQVPSIRLREYRDGHVRSWEGVARFSSAEAPEFSPRLAGNNPVRIELPDGRHGTAFVSDVHFNGTIWTVNVSGTGPAPGYTSRG